MNTAGPVSQKMLTQDLRQLERDGLLFRTVIAGKVPNVRYSLTGIGLQLRPILERMVQWGYHYELTRNGYVRQPACVLGDSAIHPSQVSEQESRFVDRPTPGRKYLQVAPV